MTLNRPPFRLLSFAAIGLGFCACRSARPTPSGDAAGLSEARTRPAPSASSTAKERPEAKVAAAVDEALAGAGRKAAAVVLDVRPRRIVAFGEHGASPTTLSLRPGSTVKPLLAFGAAEAGLAKPGEKIDCKGVYGPLGFKCVGRHGAIGLDQAIAVSCNVYFFELSERMGFERARGTFAGFGLGRVTGLAKEESAGRLPSSEWLRSKQEPATRDELWKGWVLEMGGGHGPLEVTLLQLANAYATLSESLTTRAGQRDAGAPVLAEISKGLRDAVHDPQGTGHLAEVPGLEIAGKTGTAEAGGFGDDAALKRPENAWFVGYAPATAPEVVVAVVIVEAGAPAARTAAPLAGKIFAAWKNSR